MGTVQFRLEGDDASAVRAFLNLTAAQKKAELGALRLTQQNKGSADAMQSMSRAGIQSMAGWAASTVSVAAAFSAARQALADLNEERKRAAEGATESAPRRGQLAQLAMGDPGKLESLIAETKKSRSQHGMTGEQAEKLQFAITSMGEEKERDFYAGFNYIADPGALAEGVSTLKNAFGTKETGSTRQVANKMLAASAYSKTTLEQFAPAATIAAQASNNLGGSDEVLMGTLAVMAKGLKSADVAGTQITSFARVLMENNMGGKGILGGLDEVNKITAGMTQSEQVDFFGKKEAFNAWSLMNMQRADIEKTIGDVRSAGSKSGDGDVSDRVQKSIMTNPELRAVKEKAIATEREKIAVGDKEATAQLQRERAYAEQNIHALKNDENGAVRWGLKQQQKLTDLLGLAPDTVRADTPVAVRARESFKPAAEGRERARERPTIVNNNHNHYGDNVYAPGGDRTKLPDSAPQVRK